MEDILGGFLGAILNLGNLLEIDRFPSTHSHNNVADLDRRMDKSSSFNHDLRVPLGQRPRDILPVALLKHRDDARRGQVTTCQLRGIQKHANLPP